VHKGDGDDDDDDDDNNNNNLEYDYQPGNKDVTVEVKGTRTN